MATILREATQVQYYRRAYHQVDQPPNLPVFFPKTLPFRNESTLPDRFWPRPPAQDFSQTGVTTRGIPSKPRDPNIFRTPLSVPIFGRPYLQQEQIASLVLKTLASGKPPFVPPSFPETYRRGDRDFLVFETLSYLPGPVIAPYIPVDFPTPMRAPATPQDFIFSSSGIPPAAPFNQDDWPIPIRLRGHHQDFWWSGVTTRGIPHGIAEPFSQPDWPITVRPRMAYADSYASPRILLVTPVLRPFAQTDWVNPARYRPIPIDWPWAGTTTRGIPPVPASSGPFPPVILEAYGVGMGALELHWSAAPGAFGYRIYIDGVPQPTVLHQRIVIVTGLAINTPYTFNVTCVNAFGVDASPLSNTIAFERDSREIQDAYTYPWGNTPQTGYVIKVPLDGDDDGD